MKHGKGTVTFIGTDTDNGDLEKDMVRKVYEQAGIGIENLPEGVVVQWRHGFWFGMNYSSEVQDMNIPANAKIIVGQKTLSPAEVVVWK